MTEEELYQMVWENNWPVGHRDELALKERLQELLEAEKQLDQLRSQLKTLGAIMSPWLKR